MIKSKLNPLKLGIVYKDGFIINHRSLLKIVLNPFLFQFGLYLGTVYDSETNTLKHVTLGYSRKARKKASLKWFIQQVKEHIVFGEGFYDNIEARRIFV